MSLKFNLVTSSVLVTLENGANAGSYELREMKASARDQYLDSLGDRVKTDKDGKASGIKKFEGMQADLICRCLFAEGSTTPVEKSMIQSWPASVVSSLFTEAQKINLLNTATEDKVEKNE